MKMIVIVLFCILQPQVKYLGHIIDKTGLKTCAEKVEAR